MQLIYTTTRSGSHSVTLMHQNKPVKGFLSLCPIKCINKGQEWLRMAAIAVRLNLN